MINQVETVEAGIESAANGVECSMEWYSKGKTTDELLSYLKNNDIDERARGVFIVGKLNGVESSGDSVHFIPLSSVDIGKRIPA